MKLRSADPYSSYKMYGATESQSQKEALKAKILTLDETLKKESPILSLFFSFPALFFISSVLPQTLLKDPLYIGLRHKRVRGQAYDDLLDEFMKAVSDRYEHTGLQCPLPLCCLLLSP